MGPGLCIPTFEKKQTTQQYVCMVCIGSPKISFLKFQISNPDLMWFWDHQPFRVKGSTHQLTISQMPCLGFHSAEVNGTTTTGRTTLPRLPWDIRGRTSWDPRHFPCLERNFHKRFSGVRNKYNLTQKYHLTERVFLAQLIMFPGFI